MLYMSYKRLMSHHDQFFLKVFSESTPFTSLKNGKKVFDFIISEKEDNFMHL